MRFIQLAALAAIVTVPLTALPESAQAQSRVDLQGHSQPARTGRSTSGRSVVVGGFR